MQRDCYSIYTVGPHLRRRVRVYSSFIEENCRSVVHFKLSVSHRFCFLSIRIREVLVKVKSRNEILSLTEEDALPSRRQVW